MKISCYNKGTKEKESNKKCSNLSKINGEQSNERIGSEPTRFGKCRREYGEEVRKKEGTKSDDSFPRRGESLKKEKK